MKTTKRISIQIDLAKETKIPLPSFVQHDTNIIEITIAENGVLADFGTIGRIVANYRRPDKKVISRLLTIEDGKAVYTMGAEENEVAGVGDVEFAFYSTDDTERVSTNTIRVLINANIGTDAIYDNDPQLTTLQSVFVEVKSNGDYAKAQGDYAKAQGDAVDTKVSTEVTEQVPAAVDAQVGVLANLQTTDKTSVVGAVNEVTSQLAERATKTELQAVASGSPKGTYATITDLQNAFPNGNTNIYIVNSDGNWYYWNGSTWTAGGIYLSAGLQVYQHSPSNPTVGQMWLVQSFWEQFYQYNLQGVAGASLDSGKVTTLHRGQGGQLHKAYATFAKISADGLSANISYDPADTAVNRGDTSVFPNTETFDLNKFKYKVQFDMTLDTPSKSTENFGFSLQSDGSTALIDQTDFLSVKSYYVSPTEIALQIERRVGGTGANIFSKTYPKTDLPGFSAVEIIISKTNVEFKVNGTSIANITTDLSPLAAGFKGSIYTQNWTKVTSAMTTDNKVKNFIVEKYGV